MSGFTPQSFEEAAQTIAAANNLTIETARNFLVHVGDTPEIADDGRVIVRDESGLELARIICPRNKCKNDI